MLQTSFQTLNLYSSSSKCKFSLSYNDGFATMHSNMYVRSFEKVSICGNGKIISSATHWPIPFSKVNSAKSFWHLKRHTNTHYKILRLKDIDWKIIRTWQCIGVNIEPFFVEFSMSIHSFDNHQPHFGFQLENNCGYQKLMKFFFLLFDHLLNNKLNDELTKHVLLNIATCYLFPSQTFRVFVIKELIARIINRWVFDNVFQ